MMESARPLRLCISGIAGKMGREVVRSIPHWKGIELVAGTGLTNAGKNIQDFCGNQSPSILIGSSLISEFKKQPIDILLDLTEPNSALKNALDSISHGVAPIIGTSGLQSNEVAKLEIISKQTKIPVMIIPNFSIGAVLGIKFAHLAAKWLPNAEIVEIHHEDKLDAPSGTAIETAKRINEGRSCHPTIPATRIIKVEGVRGGLYSNVPIHSVRLNGVLAQQTVIFGGSGETLEIKHSAIDRSTYMSGVELVIRSILSHKKMIVGLEELI